MKRIMSTFKNKSRADMSTILYGLMGIITIIMIMIIIYRKQFISIAITNIDDGLTASVLGSAVINIDEYGKSEQTIIYNDLPDGYEVDVVEVVEVEGEEPYVVVGIIADGAGVSFTDIVEGVPNNAFSPASIDAYADEDKDEAKYLNESYEKFIELLKTNLGLDEDMVPTGKNALLSREIDDGVTEYADGPPKNKVTVDFRIYNVYKYYYYDDEGKSKMKKYIVEFKREGGKWRGTEIGDGVDSVYVGDIDETIEETSVYAGISFYMYIGTDFNGKAQYTKVDNMSRLVEVTGD